MGDELKTGLDLRWRTIVTIAVLVCLVVAIVCSDCAAANLETEIASVRTQANQLEQAVAKLTASVGGGEY